MPRSLPSSMAQRKVQLPRGESRARVQLEFVPQQVGKFVYTISTPVLGL